MHEQLILHLPSGQREVATRSAKPLKSGLHGQIFRIEGDPDRCIKLYQKAPDRASRAARLQAMLRRPPQRKQLVGPQGQRWPQIAWPDALVENSAGEVVGMRMPFVHQPPGVSLDHVLIARERRALGIVSTLASVAHNLAAIVATCHRAGHRIVDLKPQNLMVHASELLVALIDCDDMHIAAETTTFPALACSPGYICPEGRTLSPAILGQSEDQDRFALAVLIFQLLADGHHPFAGVPHDPAVPGDVQARINNRLYPYGRQAHPRLGRSPHCDLSAVPADIQTLLEQALTAKDRPSAARWVEALEALASRGWPRPAAGQSVAGARRDPTPPLPPRPPPEPVIAPGPPRRQHWGLRAVAAVFLVGALARFLVPATPPSGGPPAAAPRPPATSADFSKPPTAKSGSPALRPLPGLAPPLAAFQSDRVQARRMQEALHQLRLRPGQSDGYWGRRSKAALEQFCRELALPDPTSCIGNAAAWVPMAALGRRVLELSGQELPKSDASNLALSLGQVVLIAIRRGVAGQLSIPAFGRTPRSYGSVLVHSVRDDAQGRCALLRPETDVGRTVGLCVEACFKGREPPQLARCG